MNGATPRRIAVGNGRRIGSAPRPVVAGNRPEIPLLGAAAARVEHRRHRLVNCYLAGGQDELAQPNINRSELGRRIAYPEREHRAFDIKALGGQHLGLPIERQVPRVFADQDMRHHRLGRQPTLDQPFRCRRLHDRLLAGAAGIFGPVGYDHLELRWDHVEPLGGVLADHMHRRPAAGAIGLLGRNRHMPAWQMGGKGAATGTALLGALGRPHWIPFVGDRLICRDRLLDVLERQMQLFPIELLRTATKLHAPQLLQQVLEALILRERLVALRDGCVKLGAHRHHQRL